MQAGPGHRHGRGIDGLLDLVGRPFLPVVGRFVPGLHALQHEAAQEHGGIRGRIRFIHVAVAKDLLHAAEQRAGGGSRLHHGPGGLDFVTPPVANPGFAEHGLAETAREAAVLAIPGILVPAAAGGEVERVGRRAQSDQWYAAFERAHELGHGLVGPDTETQRHDDDIRRLEGGGIGQRLLVVRVDGAVGVEREQHRALEAMALAEDLRQHGQRFLAAVLLVTGEQHDMGDGFGSARGQQDQGGGSGQQGPAGGGQKQKKEGPDHREGSSRGKERRCRHGNLRADTGELKASPRV